jgi:large subunit ribosomal protein L4e
LDFIFGKYDKKSLVKKNYTLPRPIMSNPDLARIINSDEIQSVVRPVKQEIKRRLLKKNPLKNLGALLKLNPYAKTARRMELLAQEQRAKAKAEKLDSKRKISKVEDKEAVKKAGAAWYKTMVSDSEYTEFKNFTKWLGVSQ